MSKRFEDRRRNLVRSAQLSLLAIAAAVVGHSADARAATQTIGLSPVTVQALGTVNVTAVAAAQAAAAAGTSAASVVAGPSLRPEARSEARIRALPAHHLMPHFGVRSVLRPETSAVAPVPTLFLPVVTNSAAGINGFDGLTVLEEEDTDNGNNILLEPPDQALAVGNGFVVEDVNDALSIYDQHGKQLVAAIANNKFFGFTSAFVEPNGPFGPSLADPRAYFDASIGRFFVTQWAFGVVPATGNSDGTSFQVIAVSETGNPTGNFFIFKIDTTNADLPACPCFPDFQRIGFDSQGIFISQNLFGLFSGEFAGNNILALSKLDLAAGKAPALAQGVLPNDITIQPTLTPPGGLFSLAEGGTEYLLEALADVSATGSANAIRVFALSGTASLQTPNPSLTLASVDVPTQSYGPTVPAIQPNTGPRPLGISVGDPTEMLDPGNEGLSSTPVFVDGRIFAALSTVVPGSATENAMAFFDFRVEGGAGVLSSTLENQGLVAAAGADNSIIYPAIAMPATLQGGIGVTITGPNIFPSTGFIPFSVFGAGPAIHLTGAGQAVDDGFTGYAAFGGNGVGRWGDYGAAAVDEFGKLWFGNEFIPNLPRDPFSNWGTFITGVDPFAIE
jgi:hypothetical protein